MSFLENKHVGTGTTAPVTDHIWDDKGLPVLVSPGGTHRVQRDDRPSGVRRLEHAVSRIEPELRLACAGVRSVAAEATIGEQRPDLTPEVDAGPAGGVWPSEAITGRECRNGDETRRGGRRSWSVFPGGRMTNVKRVDGGGEAARRIARRRSRRRRMERAVAPWTASGPSVRSSFSTTGESLDLEEHPLTESG